MSSIILTTYARNAPRSALTMFIRLIIAPHSYGEKGWTIIINVLLKLFPLKDWDSESIWPLAPMQVAELVLVPEVTVSLITEDLQGSFADALKTMYESSQYGSLMFPMHEESTEDDVGDHIVRERAMVRGRQVVIEDRVEARVLKEEGLWRIEDEDVENGNGQGGTQDSEGGCKAVKRPKPIPLRLKKL